MKIKKGDKVKVITGHYKGTIGEVLAVMPKENKVIVEGVNLMKKHLKPTQANPDGGIIECPLQITGTLPVGSGKPTAVPAEKVFAQFDRQSPRSDRTDKRRIDLFRQFGRHGYDGHRITGPQERRAQVGVMLRLSGHIGAGTRRSLEKKQKKAGKQQPSGISAAIHIVWL